VVGKLVLQNQENFVGFFGEIFLEMTIVFSSEGFTIIKADGFKDIQSVLS
jgi:hypothetical protein